MKSSGNHPHPSLIPHVLWQITSSCMQSRPLPPPPAELYSRRSIAPSIPLCEQDAACFTSRAPVASFYPRMQLERSGMCTWKFVKSKLDFRHDDGNPLQFENSFCFRTENSLKRSRLRMTSFPLWRKLQLQQKKGQAGRASDSILMLRSPSASRFIVSYL